MKKRFLALVLAGVMALSLAACGGGNGGNKGGEAALPKKIDVQVPASAGGGTDVVARALGDFVAKNSGANVVISNNTDGSGVVAMETVRTAGKADGSEILFFHSTMCIKSATGIYDHKAADDFKVIGVATPTNPGGYVLVVPAESGITDVAGFIDAVNGGKNKIGIETGGSSHIMSGMMSGKLGVELKYVEAGPDTDKLTALVGGTIDCALVNANQAKQYIESGKVNALAVFSATSEGGRNTVLPDVPSFPELGYDLVFGTYFFILGPSAMTDETAKLIYDQYVAAVADEKTAEILETSGMGMQFVAFEEAQKILADQQASLDEAVAAIGLNK